MSYMDSVLIIDTEMLLIYNDCNGQFIKIEELDNISSEMDILAVRHKVIRILAEFEADR